MDTLPPTELDLSATCDCGAVSIGLRGRVVSMFQCSCRNCQKVSGGGHSSITLMREADVTLSGTTAGFTRKAESGADFTRQFCPACGTTVCARSSRAPGLRIIPIGLFAGQNAWFVPNQLIFARSLPGWDLVADHLPRHASYRPENAR